MSMCISYQKTMAVIFPARHAKEMEGSSLQPRRQQWQLSSLRGTLHRSCSSLAFPSLGPWFGTSRACGYGREGDGVGLGAAEYGFSGRQVCSQGSPKSGLPHCRGTYRGTPFTLQICFLACIDHSCRVLPSLQTMLHGLPHVTPRSGKAACAQTALKLKTPSRVGTTLRVVPPG